MRIGIFSDIHGNLEALHAALASLEAQRPDNVFCLGDVVGYGADPNECCDLVRSVAEVTLLGNHDAAVAGRMDYSYYYDAAREALALHARQLSESNMEWLRSLPYTHRVGEVGLCHGSPLDPPEYEYIFTPEQAEDLAPIFEDLAWITFIGHSHLCRAYALAERRGGLTATDVLASQVILERGKRYVLSVGSVGQPRDYDHRSSFVMYDDETHTATYHRVEYDVERAAQKIFDGELSLHFGRRLFLGV